MNNNNPICEVDKYGTKAWYLNGKLRIAKQEGRISKFDTKKGRKP
jgi:ribosomal protein L31